MEREFFAVAAIAILVVAGFCSIGFVLGQKATISRWQNEMIRRGYAEHDAKTGEWKWIDGKELLETNKE